MGLLSYLTLLIDFDVANLGNDSVDVPDSLVQVELLALEDVLLDVRSCELQPNNNKVIRDQEIHRVGLAIKVPNMVQELNLPVDIQAVHLRLRRLVQSIVDDELAQPIFSIWHSLFLITFLLHLHIRLIDID